MENKISFCQGLEQRQQKRYYEIQLRRFFFVCRSDDKKNYSINFFRKTQMTWTGLHANFLCNSGLATKASPSTDAKILHNMSFDEEASWIDLQHVKLEDFMSGLSSKILFGVNINFKDLLCKN